MSWRIQPLSEGFLYCSPEAMRRELYRLCPVPRRKSHQKQKPSAGKGHDKTKAG